MNSRRHRRVLAVTAMVLITAACNAGSGASPGASVAPSEAAASAAQGSGSSDPGAKPGLCAKGFEPCLLPAGTYSSAPFDVPFTFTIAGDDWTNDRAWPHGGSVTRGGSDAFLWASGVSSGQINGTRTPIGPEVDDFVSHLRMFDGFTVAEPVPVTIAGASGVQVDVLTNDVDAPGMYYIEEDAFNLAPGEKVRFLILDKGGKTVILILDAFKAATFDAFVAEAGDPLLAGLTWE